MTPRSTLSLLALAPLLVGFELFQSANKAVEMGNAHLKLGKAEEALAEYDKAVKALPAEPGVHFDRGAALYALGRHDEARDEFLRATEAKTTALKAAAFYNLGNSFFQTEKYADAIAAYRRSLQLDPADLRAKWNLELALKKKKEQDQKDQNKDDKDKKDKNKDDKQDQKDDKQDKQDKNDESSKDQKQDDKQDQQKQDDKQGDKKDEPKPPEQAKNEEKPQKPEPKPGDSKKDENKNEPGAKPEKAADLREIDAVLDSLERSPKDLEKERARLRAVRRTAPSKDW